MACISNSAYTQAAARQASAIINQAATNAAIQVALALWQRNSSSSIANMQNEIADANMKMAEAVAAHAAKFWPEEKELVDDVFGEAKVTTQYTGLTSAWAGMLDKSLQEGRGVWIDAMTDMCLRPTRCEDARWQRNAQLNRSDIMSYAARQDEARTEILNERRYERQKSAIELGRGKVPALVSYQNIARVNGMAASGAVDGMISSALYAYGYYKAQPPSMPTNGWGAPARNALIYMPEGQYSAASAQPSPIVQTQTVTPVAMVTTSKATESAETMQSVDAARRGSSDIYNITGEGSGDVKWR